MGKVNLYKPLDQLSGVIIMKKMFQKSVAISATACMLVNVIFTPLSTYAAVKSKSTVISFNNNQPIHTSNELSPEDKDYLKELEKVLPFITEINGVYSLTKNDKELNEELGISSETIYRVHTLLESMNSAKTYYNSHPITYRPRVHVDNWKIYFTNDDVKGLLLSAAQAGPAAMVAAFTALGSVYPGVGNMVGSIVGLFGGAAIAYWVVQAATLNEGLYIGIDWNGPYPNPVVGTW